MEEHINNIEELGAIITNKLNEGASLCNLRYLLENYNGTDWTSYMKFSDSKYVRNIVLRNETIDIVIVCWEIHQGCGIHDHPDNGCLMRIMSGQLTEKVYAKNELGFELLNSNNLCDNQISYIQGKTGFHCISNNGNKQTVSFHIYSPPNYVPNYYVT